MGKILKLKDGTEYTATISSTVTNVQIPVASYTAVDAIKTTLTEENLEMITFDGHRYEAVTLEGDKAYREGNAIFAEFAFGLGIDDRIEMERQAAVDEYTMQLIEEGVL